MSEQFWCEHAWLGGDEVRADVLITATDGLITAVETGAPRPADAVTLTGLVIPGMANAHSHAFHRLLRARTQSGRGSFWTWRELMYRVADRLTPELYEQVCTAVYAEMALAGITAVGEFHYLHHDHGGAPYADSNAMGLAVIEGASRAGLRVTLLDTCYLTSTVAGEALVGPQLRFGDGSAQQWAERVDQLHQQVSGDVVVGAAVHSVRAVPADQLATVAEWARRHDAPLHVHSSEQTAEIEQTLAVHGCTPTRLLRDHGVLGPRTTAVHATHLTDEDVSDLDATDTGVCFCPTTERDLGDGLGPASALLDHTRRAFSLGSDSHAVIDLLEEARAVELDERLRRRERGLIPAARLLTAATVDGHRALGRSTGGRLAPGSPADLVALDLRSVRTTGGGATVENAVFAAAAADVTDVIIGGREIVRGRRHRTVPDVADRLAALADQLVEGNPR